MGITKSTKLPNIKQVKDYRVGDVLVSNIRPYFKKIWYADRDGGCSNDVLVFRSKENTYSKFLYYLLSEDTFFNYATLTAKGTKMPRGDKDAIMRYEIPNISIDVQIKIASILSALDDKIELNKKINKTLEEMGRSIFKSWFVDFEPWGGKMPDDWREVKLGDVTNEIKLKLNDMQLPVFSAVKTGNLVLSEDYFTKKVYSKDISKYIIVEPDDFSYNPARINIGSIGMNEFDFSGCVSPVYVVFRSEPGYHHFLRFFFKSLRFREEVKIRSSGSGRQVLKYEDFSLIKLFYPPIDLVRKFNNIYKIILGIINQNNIENIHLSSLRDTLLPKLMSGEIRVK